MNTYSSVRHIELNKNFLHLDVRFAPEVDDEYIKNYIEVNVNGYVWKQDVGKKVEFHYPANWWEALKERWLPYWWRKNHPTRYIYHSFKVEAWYPDLNIDSHEPVLKLNEQITSGHFRHVIDLEDGTWIPIK